MAGPEGDPESPGRRGSSVRRGKRQGSLCSLRHNPNHSPEPGWWGPALAPERGSGDHGAGTGGFLTAGRPLPSLRPLGADVATLPSRPDGFFCIRFLPIATPSSKSGARAPEWLSLGRVAHDMPPCCKGAQQGDSLAPNSRRGTSLLLATLHDWHSKEFPKRRKGLQLRSDKCLLHRFSSRSVQ